MVTNCITCPGFFFCENPKKLGVVKTTYPTPSITLKYEIQVPTKGAQVQIYPVKKPQSRATTSPLPQIIDERPLETWANTNPLRLPNYAQKATNIFLQLQDEPLSSPHEDTDVLCDLNNFEYPSFLISLPAPDDLPVEDHMAYFLSNRMDTFLGFGDCFSSAYKSLYLLSANNRALRHVLFAFVTYLNERDRETQSARYLLHLSKAIPQIQDSLNFLDFDEGQILAIPLLAYVAFWWRKSDVAKSHLRGFYKMLVHKGYLEQDRLGKVSVSTTMPSLVLLMWRVAVRLDHFFGFLSPEQETLPPIKTTAGSSRRYITDFIDPSAA